MATKYPAAAHTFIGELLTRGMSVTSQSSFGAVLNATREYLQAPDTRVPLGYTELDFLLRGGISKGQVCQLIGRTEVGKSTLGLNLLVHALEAGHAAGVISLEMTAEEVAIRTVSIANKCSVVEAEALILSNSISALAPTVEALKQLSILDTSRPTWNTLSEWVNTVQWKPSIVMLDHLKLMATYGYPKGQVERIPILAEDAKQFAKENDIALLLIHQVGRTSGEEVVNHGHLPLTLESGMYGSEQDVDYMLGVYRPERNPALEEDERIAFRNKVMVQLLKNRHGESKPEGWELHWQKPSMRIAE